jgi:His-Xaa-Ser system protein HxsD
VSITIPTDAIQWDTDALGGVALLTVDTSVYSQIAVFKTAYWYTDRCFLFLNKPSASSHSIHIEIRSKSSASKEELILICREFANNLIDQQVRQQVIAETGNIRDELIRKAFSEGSQGVEAVVLGNEKHTPVEGQSYQTDPLQISRTTGS